MPCDPAKAAEAGDRAAFNTTNRPAAPGGIRATLERPCIIGAGRLASARQHSFSHGSLVITFGKITYYFQEAHLEGVDGTALSADNPSVQSSVWWTTDQICNRAMKLPSLFRFVVRIVYHIYSVPKETTLMRKFLIVTAAIGGLSALISSGAIAAPSGAGFNVTPTNPLVTKVDYYWHQRHWHHRHWAHGHWRYWD